MRDFDYLMEHDEEALRLDVKTEAEVVRQQARWAGISPGMDVADVGCGSGKTTAVLADLVGSEGSALGIDASEKRVSYAEENYSGDAIRFVRSDILGPLKDVGRFDFVWARFILEYFRTNAFELVQNISSIVKPGGVLCLIDLDYNSLSHYGQPARLERTMERFVRELQEKANFDPFAGRKLYSHLFRLGFADIDVQLTARHLIFGNLSEPERYNWQKKVEVASGKIGFQFDEYPGGYEEFIEEFKTFFSDPGRFTYTPMIAARGIKP